MKENFETPHFENQEEKVEKPAEHSHTKRNRLLASALALFSIGGEAVAQDRKKVGDEFAEESLPKVTREYKETKTVSGEKYVGATNIDNVIVGTSNMEKDVSAIIQHNFKKPESLVDVGKMLIEPLSVSISFPYGKENIVAKVRTMLGYKDGETQIADIEIPYRYAQKFDTADPKNQEAMKKQAMEDAEKLFDKILTTTFGVSFFKKEATEHHREFSSPLTEVNKMKVEGFASPESTDGVNMEDIRNQKLSKLRAENAAETIRELFKEKNVGVSEVNFQGEGEDALSKEELQKLAQEAVKLDLTDPNNSESNKVLDIIKEYNAGNITEESTLKLLEETVGAKRKVAVHLEMNEEKKILVLPIPALLLLGYALRKMSVAWRDRGLGDGLPHSFIRAEDPEKPSVRVPHITRDGKIAHQEMERLTLEANKFFGSYNSKYDSFFLVSGSEEDSLETANAYRLAAERRGLEVIRPEHTRNEDDSLTGGFVRVLDNLSVDEGKSTEDLYNREFKNLIRLLNFGERKIEQARFDAENPHRKHVHILAFGQNETVAFALNKFFKERGMDNLEVIDFGGTNNPRKARAEFHEKIKRVK